jgi:transposase-like protein
MHAAVSPEQSLDEIPRMQRRLPAKSLDSYREEHGDNSRLGMALAYLSGDYTMKAIADEFGVHYTTISRAVKAYDSKNTR